MAGQTIEDRWLRLEPIKVGWHGMEWQRFEREIRMAFDEGVERGVLDRRYEFLFEDDAGLPQGTAQGGIQSTSGWSMPAASSCSAPTTPTRRWPWPTRSTPARCR